MKKLLIKYAPILIALTALADTQMELLSSIGLSDSAIAWIKLLGLLLALFLPSVKESFKTMAKEAELDNLDPQNPVKPLKPR
jgi:hypothetical protein